MWYGYYFCSLYIQASLEINFSIFLSSKVARDCYRLSTNQFLRLNIYLDLV
jgi:hypothetical protein